MNYTLLIGVMFAIIIGVVVFGILYLKPEPMIIPDCICPKCPECPDCHLICQKIKCPKIECTPTLNCTLTCPKCPKSEREYIKTVEIVEVPVTSLTTSSTSTTTIQTITTIWDC